MTMLSLGGCATAKRIGYEGFLRDKWQHPETVIGALAIQKGERVADLGSGSGYFTMRLSRAVGPTGKVFAVDIDEKMNAYLRKRIANGGIDNVEVITAKPDDPLLPEHGVDLVLNVNTYHHIQDHLTYFQKLQRNLTPDGRVAIIDFDQHSIPRLFGHYTRKDVIPREMREAGYELLEAYEFVGCQTFLIFRPIRDTHAHESGMSN